MMEKLQSQKAEEARVKAAQEEAENKEEKGLLLAVLMMVSLSGDEVAEDALWEHLGLLGLEKGTRHKVGRATTSLRRR